jgi:hypothetical protein
MAYGGGGNAAAARAAAIARAVKASGTIVSIEPDQFISILSKGNRPLVVTAYGGFIRKSYQYLTSYKGLAFFTKSQEQLNLPGDIELIQANRIWIPDPM